MASRQKPIGFTNSHLSPGYKVRWVSPAGPFFIPAARLLGTNRMRIYRLLHKHNLMPG